MCSSLSLLSYGGQVALVAALVTISLGYKRFGILSKNTNDIRAAPPPGKNTKKKKERSSRAQVEQVQSFTGVSAPLNVPGGFMSSDEEIPQPQGTKKKKTKRDSRLSTPLSLSHQPAVTFCDDLQFSPGPSSSRRKSLTSTGAKPSKSSIRKGDPGLQMERPQAKPRTAPESLVDNKQQSSNHPQINHITRTQPHDHPLNSSLSSDGRGDANTAGGTSGGNDSDREDEGWDVVVNRKRQKADHTAAASHQVRLGQSMASESSTKRQRQNARKREAKKAAKTMTETERLARLAEHKKALEKERMMEQLSKTDKSKAQSGGMKAKVDEGGRLVWE